MTDAANGFAAVRREGNVGAFAGVDLIWRGDRPIFPKALPSMCMR